MGRGGEGRHAERSRTTERPLPPGGTRGGGNGPGSGRLGVDERPPSPCPSPALGGGDHLRVGCKMVGESFDGGNYSDANWPVNRVFAGASKSRRSKAWPTPPPPAPSPLAGEGWGEGERVWAEGEKVHMPSVPEYLSGARQRRGNLFLPMCPLRRHAGMNKDTQAPDVTPR